MIQSYIRSWGHEHSGSVPLSRRGRAFQYLQAFSISPAHRAQPTASEGLLSIILSLVIHVFKNSFKINSFSIKQIK